MVQSLLAYSEPRNSPHIPSPKPPLNTLFSSSPVGIQSCKKDISNLTKKNLILIKILNKRGMDGPLQTQGIITNNFNTTLALINQSTYDDHQLINPIKKNLGNLFIILEFPAFLLPYLTSPWAFRRPLMKAAAQPRVRRRLSRRR